MKNKLTAKTGIPTVLHNGEPGYTWNPVRGCVNYKCHLHPRHKGKGPGHGECWAAKQCNRWAEPWAVTSGGYWEHGKWITVEKIQEKLRKFELQWFHSQFDKILPSKPCTIAVGWQSDFAYWPDEWTQKIIDKCAAHPHIVFQWLTKNPEAYGRFEWPDNCWLGFTATNQNEFNEMRVKIYQNGVNKLQVRYAYLEPLRGKIEPWSDFNQLDWIIVGGHNNGPPMHPDWVRSIRDWCIKNDVPFFFKQWGYWIEHDQLCAWQVRKRRIIKKEKLLYFYGPHEVFYPFGKKSGNILDGQKWEQMPEMKND